MESVADLVKRIYASRQAPQEPLGRGIDPNFHSAGGIAPAGLRHSGMAPKSTGYFGPITRPDGAVSTELSAESDYQGKPMEYPLMVPGLSAAQMKELMSGSRPSEDVNSIAYQHAVQRKQRGLDPFASPTELRRPNPMNGMGAINGKSIPRALPERMQNVNPRSVRG